MSAGISPAIAASELHVQAVGEDGTPIAGLELIACPADANLCETQTTDPSGYLTFTVTPDGDGSLNVAGGGKSTEFLTNDVDVLFSGGNPVYPDPLYPAQVRMEFLDADWSDINVSVVDPSGSPVAYEPIRLVAEATSPVTFDETTDENGFASFRLSPHEQGESTLYSLSAGGDTSRRFESKSVSLGTLSTQDTTLSLTPISYSISGEITYRSSADETKNRKMSVTWSNGSVSACADFVVSSDGAYSVSNIRNKDAYFSVQSCNSNTSPRFDGPDYFIFDLSEGANQTQNFALTRTGVEVTVLEGGKPAPFVNVYVTPSDQPDSYRWSGTSGADGKALILRMSPGTYLLRHVDQPGYSDSGKYYSVTNETTFEVTGTDSVAFDTLNVVRQESYPETPVTVSGHVVTGVSKTPVAGATVYVSANIGTYPNEISVNYSTQTDDEGYYELSQIFFGRVYVDISKAGFRNAWTNFSTSSATGTSIVRDFNLRPLPLGDLSFSGVLEDEDGNPVVTRTVTITPFGTGQPNTVETDENGAFAFTGLYSSAYYLNIDTWSDELYDQPPWTTNYVNLVGDDVDRRIVLKKRLTGNASVSGHVAEYLESEGTTSATPLVGKYVWIYPRSGGQGYSAETDANGDWSITGLPNGVEYYVNVPFDYQRYEYPGTNLAVSAESGGQPLETLLKIPSSSGSGSLTGRVKDASNYKNIAGITVSLWRSRGGVPGKTVQTNASGEYSFTNLPSGDYGLNVGDGFVNYQPAHMSVEIDGSANRINALLTPLGKFQGTITGHVIDERGVALAGAYVSAWDPDHSDNGDAMQTDGNGFYSLKNVPTDTPINLRVRAPYDLGYEVAGHFESLSILGSEPNVVREISLAPAGVISGQVRGIPLEGNVPSVGVELIDKSSLTTVDVGWVNSQTGAYALTGVEPGQYVLRFTQRPIQSGLTGRHGDGGGGFDGEVVSLSPVFWDGTEFGATDISGAQTLSVTGGSRIGNKSVSMVPGSKIEGNVLIATADGATKITGTRWVYVTVYKRQGDGTWLSQGYPDAVSGYSNSRLTSAGLSAGAYKLKFEDSRRGNNSLSTVYNGGAPSLADAPEIIVGEDSTVEIKLTMSAAPPEKSAEAFELDILDSEILNDTRDGIESDGSVESGATEEFFVGQEFSGEYVAAFANSTPVMLSGWTQVDSRGYIEVTIPSNLSGTHRIAVQDANEQVLGWTTVEIDSAMSGSAGRAVTTNALASPSPVTRGTKSSAPKTSSNAQSETQSMLESEGPFSGVLAWSLSLAAVAAAMLVAIAITIRRVRRDGK
jgi:protocatechuate 3,4-dioxygenase beta subunit